MKAIFNNLENFHLHDVGLIGQTRAEIIDGVGSFTSLKFSTTSYINEVNFCWTPLNFLGRQVPSGYVPNVQTRRYWQPKNFVQQNFPANFHWLQKVSKRHPETKGTQFFRREQAPQPHPLTLKFLSAKVFIGQRITMSPKIVFGLRKKISAWKFTDQNQFSWSKFTDQRL